MAPSKEPAPLTPQMQTFHYCKIDLLRDKITHHAVECPDEITFLQWLNLWNCEGRCSWQYHSAKPKASSENGSCGAT